MLSVTPKQSWKFFALLLAGCGISIYALAYSWHMFHQLADHHELASHSYLTYAYPDKYDGHTPIEGHGRRLSYVTLHYYFKDNGGDVFYATDEVRRGNYNTKALLSGKPLVVRYSPADPRINELTNTIYGSHWTLLGAAGELGFGIGFAGLIIRRLFKSTSKLWFYALAAIWSVGGLLWLATL